MLVLGSFNPVKITTHAEEFDSKDLYKYTIPVRETMIISTGLSFELLESCYGRIASRSGLAIRYLVDVGDKIKYLD